LTIVTRAGDRGWTRVLGGKALRKDHPRLMTLGALDGLNASLGVARAFVRDAGIVRVLGAVQSDLFAVGSHIAGGTPLPARSLDAFLSGRVVDFEADIDRRERSLPRLTSFVLPGGTPGGALLHLSNTACRTAERAAVSLSRTCRVSVRVIAYLNRLSALLFVLARVENRRAGAAELRVGTRPPARALKRPRRSRP
jgi:cob(I)alamin adenosyltransferase